MGDLSAHFSRSEFRCKHCGVGTASPQLLKILENLRTINGGRPLSVLSGFRCRVHNANVGGAQDSRHMYGDAADLREGLFTATQARAAGAVGVGVKNGWAVHVDWRPGGPVLWNY